MKLQFLRINFVNRVFLCVSDYADIPVCELFGQTKRSMEDVTRSAEELARIAEELARTAAWFKTAA